MAVASVQRPMSAMTLNLRTTRKIASARTPPTAVAKSSFTDCRTLRVRRQSRATVAKTRNVVAYVRNVANPMTRPPAPVSSIERRCVPSRHRRRPTGVLVIGRVVNASCRTAWLHVKVPVPPERAHGYVRVFALRLTSVKTRIVVEIAKRRLSFIRAGHVVLSAPVAGRHGRDADPEGPLLREGSPLHRQPEERLRAGRARSVVLLPGAAPLGGRRADRDPRTNEPWSIGTRGLERLHPRPQRRRAAPPAARPARDAGESCVRNGSRRGYCRHGTNPGPICSPSSSTRGRRLWRVLPRLLPSRISTR